MAVPFIVEDGTGLADATSYLSVAEANVILEANPHVYPVWSARGTSDRQKLLVWATRVLDAAVRWYGRKTVESSALRWPRTGVVDRDGVALAATVLPPALKLATATFAASLGVADRTAERDQDGLVSLKADVVELEFRDGFRIPTVPGHVGMLLIGLGATPGTGIRMARLIR